MMRTKILLGAMALSAYQAALAEEPGSGKSVYEGTCIACHGADGKGTLPGVPDLTKKDGPLRNSDDVLRKRILEGFQSPGSPMAMPPKGGNPALTTEQARLVVNYLRREFGHK